MKKVPFVTLDKLQEITAQFPTPFHLYDEKGIRENAKAVKEAFAWNKGFKEFFAVKATPNPFLIQILQEYGCGCDFLKFIQGDKWYFFHNNLFSSYFLCICVYK